MSQILHLLCLSAISAILCVDHVKARSTRRLVGEGIRGGTYAEDGQFPYQISLELDGESVCGGSILTERFVITAAHCTINEYNKFMNEPLKIIAGTVNLNSEFSRRIAIDVSKVYVPGVYDSTELEYGEIIPGDIAILELLNNLDFESNPNLGKVKLPENNENDYIGKIATISGFGWNEVYLIYDKESLDYIEMNGKGDNKLRFAQAKVTTHEVCRDSYTDWLHPTKVTHLCAAIIQRFEDEPEGLCSGDSGGGLIYDGTIIGVVNKSPNGCREVAKPAIYARVSHYLSFINNVLNGEIDDSIRTTKLKISS